MKSVPKRRMNSGRKLGFENLEKREVLAANVNVALSAGVLTITDADTGATTEDIDVAWSDFGGTPTITVVGGVAGQLINGSNTPYTTTATVNKIVYFSNDSFANDLLFQGNGSTRWSLNHLDITTGSGSDIFYMDLIDLTGYLSIAAGAGNNNITVQSSSAAQNATITTGSGNDTILVNAFSMSSTTHHLTITTDDGNDDLDINNVDAHSLAYSNINSGNGNDTIEFIGTNQFKDLTVTMYAGDDLCSVYNTLTVSGTNSADGGLTGTDTFTGFSAITTINGGTFVKTNF